MLVLCSEQLSNQKHYDYGMRAVFSILVRAGKLRQLLGEQWTGSLYHSLILSRCYLEPMIVLSAVTDVNLPKFNTNDIPLFLGITSDLFPGVELPKNDYGELVDTLTSVCSRRNLRNSQGFMKAIIQLYETVALVSSYAFLYPCCAIGDGATRTHGCRSSVRGYLCFV